MKAVIVAVASYFCFVQLIGCAPYQSSCDHLGSINISYKYAESEEDIWKIGCNIRCRLTETGIFRDGIVHSTIVDPDFKEHDVISECSDRLHAIKSGLNCTHFYDLWKCMEQLREPWSHLENFEDMEKKCVGRDVCQEKCIYEELGIFKEDVFTSENTSEVLGSEYRKYIVKSLTLCHGVMNKLYEEPTRYTCEYFKEFDLCFKKQTQIF